LAFQLGDASFEPEFASQGNDPVHLAAMLGHTNDGRRRLGQRMNVWDDDNAFHFRRRRAQAVGGNIEDHQMVMVPGSWADIHGWHRGGAASQV
jgi:hypothetical protein